MLLLEAGAVERATVRQKKTGRAVKFELSDQTREAVDNYLRASGKKPGQFLLASRRDSARHISTRQYARLLSRWIAGIGLNPKLFGTHSLRRTKATLIYRRTGNLRAVQRAPIRCELLIVKPGLIRITSAAAGLRSHFAFVL